MSKACPDCGRTDWQPKNPNDTHCVKCHYGYVSQPRDIVIPWKQVKDDDGWELRMMLRTLRMMPVNRVYIFGEAPNWINQQHVTVIPTDPQDGKWWDLDHKFRMIAQLDCLTDEVYYTEDDYFITKPQWEIPHYWVKDLSERIMDDLNANRRGKWVKSLIDTHLVLDELKGNQGPHISFDMHIPMIINRQLLKDLIPQVDATQHANNPLRWRSIVGNYDYTRPTRHAMTDVKCVTIPQFLLVHHYKMPFLSSNEDTLWTSGVGHYLQINNPNPSRYEK